MTDNSRMVELSGEEYGLLLWCAINDDRRMPDVTRAISAHWDDLPLKWKDIINDRRSNVERDAAGAVLNRDRHLCLKTTTD